MRSESSVSQTVKHYTLLIANLSQGIWLSILLTCRMPEQKIIHIVLGQKENYFQKDITCTKHQSVSTSSEITADAVPMLLYQKKIKQFFHWFLE